VYDFLLSDPDRATEITIIATALQDSSVERLDAVAPPVAPPSPLEIDINQENFIEDFTEDNSDRRETRKKGKIPGQKRRRGSAPAPASAPGDEAAAVGASATAPAQADSSPARSYRRLDESSPFVVGFPLNSGAGWKLGKAITISSLLIQGPFPKEDKDDSPEHRRHVQSAMLNVYSDGKIATFVDAGIKFEAEMQAYCLAKVEVARVTKQRAVVALQKFLNTTFFSSLGCKEKWRGTRDLLIIIALRLSMNVWLCAAAHFGFQGTASILDRWKKDDGSNKYDRLCPDDVKDSRSYPCKSETDGRAVAMLVANLLRLDGRHPYKDGAGHDPLRAGNKPLALFGATSPKYSELGCFVITEFWCKAATLGPLTKANAFSTPTEVDLVFEKDWKM